VQKSFSFLLLTQLPSQIGSRIFLNPLYANGRKKNILFFVSRKEGKALTHTFCVSLSLEGMKCLLSEFCRNCLRTGG
jgi:hypothetical protein